MVMGLLQLSAPSPEPSLTLWDGAEDAACVPEEPSLPACAQWMDAGEEKNSHGPHQPESPSWFVAVTLNSLPVFKLSMVPGDESKPSYLEHTWGDQR